MIYITDQPHLSGPNKEVKTWHMFCYPRAVQLMHDMAREACVARVQFVEATGKMPSYHVDEQQRLLLFGLGVAEAGLAYANKNPDAFKNVIDGAVKKLLDEGLDQSKELESDRLGVVFASRVGYDPNAYITFLDRLRTIKGDDRAFFKTHPDFSNRLSAVQSTIREQGLKATGILLTERFTRSSTGTL